MSKRPSAKHVKIGDFIAVHNNYQVEHIDDGEGHDSYVHCKNTHNGGLVRIGKGLFDGGSIMSTDYVAPGKVYKVTQTQMAQKLEFVGQMPFSVCFTKKVDPNAVADGLANADLGSQAKRRKVVKQLMQGEERVLHGVLDRSGEDDVQMELGRYRVIDLDAKRKGEHAQRLVDTRTIRWLVCDGVKYHTD